MFVYQLRSVCSVFTLRCYIYHLLGGLAWRRFVPNKCYFTYMVWGLSKCLGHPAAMDGWCRLHLVVCYVIWMLVAVHLVLSGNWNCPGLCPTEFAPDRSRMVSVFPVLLRLTWFMPNRLYYCIAFTCFSISHKK